MTAAASTGRRRCRRGDESGSTLILALVFISLFGLFIAALLSESTVGLRTNDGARRRTGNLLAADGGVEWGIHQARNDATCPTTAAGQQTLTSTLALGARTATITCRDLVGAVASPAGQQWAVITTSPAVDSLTTVNLAGDPVTVSGGDVWAGGGLSLARDLAISDGDLATKLTSCAGAVQPAKATVSGADLWSCTTAATPDVPHALPAAPAVASVPTNTTLCSGQTWQIFHPGKYTSVLSEHPELTQYNYFESGIYYFEDVGNLDFTNRVTIGGQAPAGETAVVAPACTPNDTTAGALSQASGKGVTFVLGGHSSLVVGHYTGAISAFELYTRVPAAADSTSTPGISLIAAPVTANGYKAWQAIGAYTYAFATATALTTGVPVAVHGLLYAPTALVYINTRATPPFMAGVVASKLIVTAGAPGSVAAVAAQGRRTLLLTSTASSGAAGEITTVENAVVKIANDPTRTATVRSWRVL